MSGGGLALAAAYFDSDPAPPGSEPAYARSPVVYQVDQRPPVAGNMLLGGYGRVVGVTSFLYGDAFSLRVSGEEASMGRSRLSATEIVAQWFGGDVLRVQFTPESGAPYEVRFDISGLAQQIAPLRDACSG